MARSNRQVTVNGRVAIIFVGLAVILYASIPEGGRRQLVNPREVFHEIKLAPGTEASVKKYFPSFREYHELILYHPMFGYYSSGRVSFVNDFDTFPNVLAPYFGQMVAQQVFRMWDGMRRAGTIQRGEKFTIAEVGAGNGRLAESILDYLEEQLRENPDTRWHEFASQALYVAYDRAPALREVQRRRNARFGSRFEARDGDATNLTVLIPVNRLKGIILSNELLDVFGVHKVILSQSGSAEAAFVAPSLPRKAWNEIKTRVTPALEQIIVDGDQAIKNTFFAGEHESDTYLSREAFVALLESLREAKDYAAAAQSIQFHEVYVPAGVVPELKEHLKSYAHTYALELASRGKGIVAYINLGEEKFIHEAGRALKAGYVVTIDYGSNWDGIMKLDQPHLRTYGPGNQQSGSSDLLTGLALGHMEAGRGGTATDPTAGWNSLAEAGSLTHAGGRGNPDPYRSPTLNDVTTDVNFSYLAAEGAMTGLRTVYFGPQRALQTGTSISFNAKNAGPRTPDRERELGAWLGEFAKDSTFKILIQQKQGTDDSYMYPDNHPQPLDVDEGSLSATQRRKASEIEQALRGGSK